MSRGVLPLSERLLLVAALLPLCDAAELACFAGGHPAAARRALGALVVGGLLRAEAIALPPPRRLRFTPTREGAARATAIARRTASVPTDRLRDTPWALLRLRNRLERVAAARAVFGAVLASSRAHGLTALAGWQVPGRVGRARADGVGLVVAGGTQWRLAVLLDTPHLAPHHLLPSLHALLDALAVRGVPALVLLLGTTPPRAQLVWSALRADTRAPAAAPLRMAAAADPSETGWLATLVGEGPVPSLATAGGVPLAGGGSTGTLAWALPNAAEATIARQRARLTAAQLAALDRLADHPLQGARGVGELLGVSPVAARHALRPLCRAGLVLALPGCPPAYVLSEDALRLLAVRDGWPPRAYARARGVATVKADGRGMAHVLKYLPHTRGADAFFRHLGRRAAATGHREALVTWEGPAACQRTFDHEGRRRSIRPDGFGVYRVGGVDHPFHLEWDRGTMRPGQYARKLAAYRAYAEAAAFLADRRVVPTLLFVFSRPDKEASTLALARVVLAGIQQPLLATSRWRMERYGVDAPIWRSPFEQARRAWLLRDDGRSREDA